MKPDVDRMVTASHRWSDEMSALRAVLLDCDVAEEVKWNKPCYTHDGSNIAIVQEMKEHLALMFFKGALLDDPDGALRAQGPNSRSAKRLEFTSTGDVERLADAIRDLVADAIRVEQEGLDVEAPGELVLAAELQHALDADAELRRAFEALTPGRRREYNLHVSGAKKASTRTARVEKHVDRIKAGRGLRDR